MCFGRDWCDSGGHAAVGIACCHDECMTESAEPQNAAPSTFTGVIAVLGGTGEQGRGLATRFAAAGVEVVIGSRIAERAMAVAAEIGFGARGTDNAQAASQADVVIVAVPWDGHEATIFRIGSDACREDRRRLCEPAGL